VNSRVRTKPPRLATVVAFALLGLLATIGVAGAAKTKGTPLGLPAHSSLLFTMNAKAGTMEPAGKGAGSDRYRLDLSGIDRRTVWFADRPDRDAGRLDTGSFFAGWGKLGFHADPPNAALVAKVGKRTKTLAVELKLRHYDRKAGDASFDARVLGSLGGGLRHLNQALAASPPREFRAPTLFIDNGEDEPSCTLGESRLVAVSPSSSGVIKGMIPANGQVLNVNENDILFTLWGYTYGGSGQHFNAPNLTAPAGLSWFVCAEGDYPTGPSLSPSCTVGQTVFWALPLGTATRGVTAWLPAGGQRISAYEYPEYAQRFAGPDEAQVALPNVSGAPPGTIALTCVAAPNGPFEFAPVLGQVNLFPALTESQEERYLPATGVTVPKNAPLGALLEADKALGGKTPNLPAAGSLANWYVSATGAWPLN
jgi:microcystin-dependent protein